MICNFEGTRRRQANWTFLIVQHFQRGAKDESPWPGKGGMVHCEMCPEKEHAPDQWQSRQIRQIAPRLPINRCLHVMDGLLYEYRIMFAALLALQKAREANLLCEGPWHIPYFLLPRQVETKPLLHFVFEEASLWHL